MSGAAALRGGGAAGSPAAALTYAVVTPARDEAENLPRLAACLAAQSRRPALWVIVENGSTDGTLAVASELARRHPWVRVLSLPVVGAPARGAPIVRALHAGFAALDPAPDVAVNVDADITAPPRYFEGLVREFAADPLLGMASGVCYEEIDGDWRPHHVTGATVKGATRAYRWECLQEVLPLEERVGWDGIDQYKASTRGWRTASFPHLTFRHHRPEGSRDGPGARSWINSGHTCWYVGYRPWYLALRSVHRARDNPAALAMLWGYAIAGLRREPRHRDPALLAYVRDLQRPAALGARIKEALGRR